MRLAIAVLIVILGASASPAFARKRVVLLTIEGRGGPAVRTTALAALEREVTVLSDRLFRSRQDALGITELTDDGYARMAAELAADAIVSGTWQRAGTDRARVTLIVRAGQSGAVVGEVVVMVPRRALDRAARDAIAAKLLPVIAAIEEAGDPGIEIEPNETDGGAGDGGPADDEPADPADDTDGDADGDDGADDGTGPVGESTFSGSLDDPMVLPPGGDGEAGGDPSSSAGAGLGPIGGTTFAYLRAPVDGGDFQQVSASLWLNARPRYDDAISARLEVALDDLEVAQPEVARLRLHLREAYVSVRKRGWLLRAGRQIIPWGASDVVNPTDFLTARDLRVFAVDAEQQRLGATSLLVSYASPRFEVTVVATPFFPRSAWLIPPSALPAGVSLDPPAAFAAAPEDTEVAGKLKLSGQGWDLAVVGFRGKNHAPELELVSASETAVVMRQTHHRILAGGIDGSATAGKLIVRLEAAFVVTENRDGRDPTIQPSHAFGVLGVERPLGDRLRVQAQAVVRAYPQWAKPSTATGQDLVQTAALQGVAAANALILDYQDQVRPAATARVAYRSADERIEAEVFGAVNFVRGDFLVRPLLGWHPAPPVALQLGLDYYGGRRDQPLGALHTFGGAFAQAAYTF